MGLSAAHFKAACWVCPLAEVNAVMANIPYSSGYAPQWWKWGTDVLIPKWPDNDRVDYLHPILLLEPDFNQNNKRLGWDMMAMAEARGSLAREQYNSRKGHSAIA